MATHSNILAWKIPMDRGAWWTAWGHKESDTTEQLLLHFTSMTTSVVVLEALNY